jgi:hypothetical protein
MEVDGQCHCGRVTYRAAIDPAKVSICHCTDCQNLTGSPWRRSAAPWINEIAGLPARPSD